jgi:hypothetical protein
MLHIPPFLLFLSSSQEKKAFKCSGFASMQPVSAELLKEREREREWENLASLLMVKWSRKVM